MRFSLIILCAMLVSSVRADEKMPPEMTHPPEAVTLAQVQALPAHPRLLATAARWEELRQLIKTDPRHRELFTLLRRSADETLRLPPVVYERKFTDGNLLAIIRDAEHRIFTLAMVYRLTGEKPYLEGARSVLHGLADLTWPTNHYLDPTTACLSLSVGLDWLYDDLTAAEREQFAAKIVTEALAPTTKEPEKLGVLWADINWNQICNTGLTFGALAVAEREPAMAQLIVNRTIAVIPRAASAAYAPDGLYPEGPGYWAYGTGYHVQLIEALRSCFGSSENLEKFPGFLASAAVIDQLTGPSGEVFNYSDNHPKRLPQSLVFWFARETARPDMADAEWQRVKEAVAARDPKGNRGLALDLLWLPDPSKDSSKAFAAPLHWRAEGHQPVAVLRSAWQDPKATWLAIKGGTANYSHGHMDSGSFVLEAGGVRWALDPEIEDYLEARARTGLSHGEFFSYAQDSKRWDFFRWGPEGHNIPRFNNARQNVEGHATLEPIQESAEGASVGVNLDSTYAGPVSRMRREVILKPDGNVVLTDSWTTSDRPAEVAWQWLTAADASLEPGGVLLKQNGQTLHLRANAPENAKIEIQKVSTLLHPPYDVTDPGWTRIVVHADAKAATEGKIQVTASLDR